ncbi:MAG TPA: ornithine carbamoyltransferase [Deltaproteobacteria bacterium]|nr:ornithine carbamoyltransferase [Deltaproteobacteria bacterium]
MKRDFLSLRDFSRDELSQVLEQAQAFKQGRLKSSLEGKAVVMVFEKASTRTRISFEVGIDRLGGHPIVLTPGTSQMGRGEPLKDTARILSRYAEMIVMRTYAHATIEEIAQWADVPVINALTDLLHPCQVLSDCFTLSEIFGELTDKKIAWIGDGNNMANSWINAAALFGFELSLACPAGYEPDKAILNAAFIDGAKVTVVRDPAEAVAGAIAVNTDVWASMGQEEESGIRAQAFQGYQVDARLMGQAAPEAVFMHCLPAHRGEEVSEEVLESAQSVVWDQAENRLYVQEAIMDFLIGHHHER